MKKILLSLVVLITISAVAQNTCSTPYLFESGSTNTFTLPINTSNTAGGVHYGCLSTQPNPLWFYFEVCDTGSIQIVAAAQNTSQDLDFVIWGPLASPYDCAMDSTQIVGCDYGTTPTANINISNLQFGYYKFIITNYSNMTGVLDINQTGGNGVACANYGCLPNAHQICKVTADSIINKNVVYWVKESSFEGEFRVQKETTTAGIYNTIGTVLSSDSSMFIDSVSNPIQQAYRYKLETVDTCGATRVSNFHQTIHLQNSTNSGTLNMELSWTPYIGINYSTYYIYRGTSPTNTVLYDSISSSFTTYTDVNPLPGSLYYSVGVYLPSACSYTGSLKTSYELIKSNVSTETSVNIIKNNYVAFNLYPNPAKELLNISFGSEFVSAQMSLIDLYGRTILSKKYNNINKDEIDLSDLPQGYYFVVLDSEKGMSRKTFVKTK